MTMIIGRIKSIAAAALALFLNAAIPAFAWTSTCEPISGNPNGVSCQLTAEAPSEEALLQSGDTPLLRRKIDGANSGFAGACDNNNPCTVAATAESDGPHSFIFLDRTTGIEIASEHFFDFPLEDDPPPAPGGSVIGGLIGPTTGTGSIIATITDSATDASPYALAVFGALTTLSVGLALINRARKGVVGAFKETPHMTSEEWKRNRRF